MIATRYRLRDGDDTLRRLHVQNGACDLVAGIVSVGVNGRQLSRRAPGVAGMLLLLFVTAGLLLMHGVQSSASPTDIRGVPLMPATTTSMPAGHGEHAVGHSCPCDGHHHPGGQMCLALLVLGSLLLFGALLVRSVPGRTTPPPGAAVPGHGHSGRSPPPPSIFQLSVLRL
ncbi:DUF6153 family protein [Actinoallomurus sp. CA-142502]|uniref:DUF6153 family protein n=1 Tax=Actinoallomurus sp. CA-142502 TaxID=3239885 RepID=UPI003D935BF4